MKKIRYGILVLCFMFMLGGCAKQEENVEKSTTTPLLLEAKKEGSDNKLYLFGSIHAADESLYPLPDYVVKAYKESKIVAVEFDLIEYEKDLEAQFLSVMMFTNPNGKSIKKYIDEETYNKGVEILKAANIYTKSFDSYNPIMWQMLVDNAAIVEANLDEEYGVDKFFLELSKKDKKEILELESAEFQNNILLGFDRDVQKYLLKQSIDQYESSKDDMKNLYELYKKGNKENLENLLLEEEPDEHLLEYNDILITKRNINMTESLVDSMKENKNIFCIVGLAHIIGEGGIANLLEQQGYMVSIVK